MFAKWLWRDGRVREDPLCHLSMGRVVTKRTRNALEPEDAAGLIATTRSEPIRWGMTGEDRCILYAIALGTGFRAKECRSLTPEDFNLDGDQPTITCRAAYTEEPQPSRPADPPRVGGHASPVGPWESPGKPRVLVQDR